MLEMCIAVSENGVMGKDGKLPWNIPAERKIFRDRIEGETVIVGRKTYETLPKLLAFKEAVVITAQNGWEPKIADERVWPVYDPIEYLKATAEDEDTYAIVIGGAEVCKLALPYCQKLRISLIENDYEGDAFFPVELYQDDFELSKNHEEVLHFRKTKMKHSRCKTVSVDFQTWERKAVDKILAERIRSRQRYRDEVKQYLGVEVRHYDKTGT